MPNIRPVSDLKNYMDVLNEISADTPVFLTKEGKGRYAIVDMETYEKTQATIRLMSELAESEQAAKENDWIDSEDVISILGVNNDKN